MKKLKKRPQVAIKPNSYRRPNWDEYFLNLCDMVGTRGTCDRGRCGAVIVRDHRILCTGYAGSPPGLKHCDEVGHEIMTSTVNGDTSSHCVRTTHSELNAICQAARDGISLKGATIYIKMEPCYTCAKAILSTGIVRVVCLRRYHRAERSREILKQSGVKLKVILDEEQVYASKK